jgi:gas vesicle protein
MAMPGQLLRHFLCPNVRRRIMNVIIFMIGFLVGAVAGIFTMCLVQINRDTEKELRQAEIREEIRKAEEEKCKETS